MLTLPLTMIRFQSTLPRGERQDLCSKRRPEEYFNPRSHEGSDKLGEWRTVRHNTFQSTLPRGERLQDIRNFPLDSNFNPRSHEGSDPARVPEHRPPGNFNPRSHEGSDRGRAKRDRYIIISIHAPTRGATLARVYSRVQPHYFNPRSHEGSDHDFLRCCLCR